MKLKNKILIGAALLVAIPVIISSLIIGYQSSASAYQAMEQSTNARLLAVRDITKGRIEDYLLNIDKQVRTFSQDTMIVDAMKSFKSSYNRYESQVSISPNQAKDELADYYQQEFNARYKERNQGENAAVGQWISNLSNTSLLLQHQLIKNNPNSLGNKDQLSIVGNNTDYDYSHQLYHPVIQNYLKEFEYYDIFLVDSASGNVVYSVFKELDFATSLTNGSFANSGLGKIFRKAQFATEPGESVVTDFSSYQPSYQDAAAFIASPIFDQGKNIGVLVFQMPIGRINQIMTQGQHWQMAGLGESGETYLIGADRTLRSESRFMLEDLAGYVAALKQFGMSPDLLGAITDKNTGIGLQSVNTRSAEKALNNQVGLETVDDYRGVSVLSAYAPIKFKGLNWAILAEIDTSEAFASANAMTTAIEITAVLVGLVLIVLGSLAGLAFAKKISQPIVSLSNNITRVEQHSDLTYRFTIDSDDEIGVASNALNSMLTKFHSGIKDVAHNSVQIATTAEQASVVTSQNSILIDEQQSQTTLVATAMEQMTCAIEEVAGHIGNVVIAVNDANEQSTEGYNLMKSTVDSVNHLAQQIDSATEVINDFELHSIEIMAVLDVIKGVAEQTNLLALNAAIEAARAGEQGRGFAVVADEVRALAGRTQQSTAEISDVIDKLKSSSAQAVKVMEQSQLSAKDVVEQAKVASDRFAAVSEAIHTVNDMNSQIAAAVEQQRATTIDINKNVLSISDAANECAEGSKQTAAASFNLASLGGNLRQLVAQFKI